MVCICLGNKSNRRRLHLYFAACSSSCYWSVYLFGSNSVINRNFLEDNSIQASISSNQTKFPNSTDPDAYADEDLQLEHNGICAKVVSIAIRTANNSMLCHWHSRYQTIYLIKYNQTRNQWRKMKRRTSRNCSFEKHCKEESISQETIGKSREILTIFWERTTIPGAIESLCGRYIVCRKCLLSVPQLQLDFSKTDLPTCFLLSAHPLSCQLIDTMLYEKWISQ